MCFIACKKLKMILKHKIIYEHSQRNLKPSSDFVLWYSKNLSVDQGTRITFPIFFLSSM